jgi:peroxiredoxin Q/BCP
VLGVSTDSLDTHQKFSSKYGISYPLIADDGSLKSLYGKRRVTYIIDRQRTIRFIQQGVPDNQELLAELSKLP